MMRTFGKPDVKAPRYRKEAKPTKFEFLLKDFKKKFPQYKDLDVATMKNIVGTHNTNIWKEVTQNWEGVDLPQYMGHLVIAGSRVFKENINVPESIKLGQKVLHKNWETDGHVGKIYYSNLKSTYFLKNRKLWLFEATRDFKRTTGKMYKENWKNFMVLDSCNISKIYRKTIKKQSYREYLKKTSENYNEFDMT